MNSILINEKMYELQIACNRYKSVDPLADWVLYAFHKYIYSGRATRKFEEYFCSLPDVGAMTELIKYCLNRDRSDDGIIKSARIFMSK